MGVRVAGCRCPCQAMGIYVPLWSAVRRLSPRATPGAVKPYPSHRAYIKRQETPRPLWRRGRMELVTEVLSALIPPAVVGGAFIFGVVKLVRAEGPGRRPNRQDQAEKSN